MGKIIYTLFINFRYYFLHYFCPVLLISLLISAVFIIADMKKNQLKLTYRLLKSKKHINLFCFLFYIGFIFQSTVFDRLITGQRQEPLSDIFGGWFIIETQYFFDFSVIWNLFMLMPIALFVLSYQRIKNKKITSVKLIMISTIIGFTVTLSIETMQLWFSVGTFQISDLVYNTLGALIGSIITALIIYKRKK